MMIFQKLNFWNGIKSNREFRLSFFLADNSDSGRQSLQTWSDKVREERRPKPFRRTINVYPLVGFFEEKPTGKHLSITLVVYQKIV